MKFLHANLKAVLAMAVVVVVSIHTNWHIESLLSLEEVETTVGGIDIPSIVNSNPIFSPTKVDSSDLLPSEKLRQTTATTKTATKTIHNNSTHVTTKNHPQRHERKHSIWGYPLPHNNPQQQHTRAIVLLSMGPGAADSTLVERCIISIRSRGRFLGPILLLTDASTQRFASLTIEDEQLVLMHPLPSDWNFALKRDLPYKRFKTYILSYLERDDRLKLVSMAYYLDIDLVVGQDLQPWFEYAESHFDFQRTSSFGNKLESSSLRSLSEIVLFEGNISPLQGGQFVVQKGRSQGCLERWRYYMDSDLDEHKDQASLTKMWNEQHQQQQDEEDDHRRTDKNYSSIAVRFYNCTILRMPQKPYLTFLSTKEMASLKGGGGGKKAYPTLMHVKNTQHAQLIPGNIQREFYQNLLQLPSELMINITARKRIRPNRTWTQEQVKHGYSL